MELGLTGKSAIVCASSAGLGLACATSLAVEGVHLVINGRNRDRLENVAMDLRRSFDVDVKAVAGDLGDATTRAGIVDACPEPDILVTNNGGTHNPPIREASVEDWHRSFDMVALPALELTRSVIDGMASRSHGRIVNITSITVRLPMPSLAVSASARAAATAVMNALAREVAHSGVTINNILPGPFETDELARLFKIRAEREGKSIEEIRAKRLQEVPVGRFGRVEEVGALCAFLCSQHAGFITGRDLLIDGGVFPTSP